MSIFALIGILVVGQALWNHFHGEPDEECEYKEHKEENHD